MTWGLIALGAIMAVSALVVAFLLVAFCAVIWVNLGGADE